ncbi:MAG TPA: site-2 protease family protein, partial [Pirellulales bacterium]|nr:site-2 protease family protein [Pirellulales bacterium]
LPGDKVVQIASVKNPVFRDLQRNVMVGDNPDDGVPFFVERKGVQDPIEVRVVPIRTRGARMVGLASGHTNELGGPPVSPFSAIKGFQPHDRVISVDDQPVTDFAELDRILNAQPGAITLTVERTLPAEAGEKDQAAPVKTEVVKVDVPPIRMRSLGIAMQMGAVAAVQDGSPAAAADIRAGDRLLRIDGEALGDPLRLPAKLGARAGTTAQLEIERDGATITKAVKLRDYYGGRPQLIGNDPIDIPCLGVAIVVENVVAAVEPGGPAEKAGVKAGDEIVHAAFVPPDAEEQKRDGIDPPLKKDDLEFDSQKKRNWLALFEDLQKWPRGTKVELTLKEGDRKVTMEPQGVEGWLNPDRGFHFNPVIVLQKAESFSQAVGLGLFETEYSLSLVYRILHKVLTGDVSPKNFGGPVMIAQQAGAAASQGWSPFLIFLGMLSANLAVINFLPIPLLDGGHMVFLAVEGIRRKPANEKVATCLQFAGLFLVLSLMAFVIMLDLGVISRG